MQPLNINNSSYFPQELHKEIHNQAEISTLVKCREVCQLWRSLVEENAQYKLALMNRRLILSGLKIAPQEIAEAFGGYEKMLELPVLSTGDNDRDYLDYFYPEDMEHSIMRGRDIFRRPFIAFKINTNDSRYRKTFKIDINDSKISIFTLFSQSERTSGGWVGCFSHPYPSAVSEIERHFGFRCYGIDRTSCANSIKELIKGDPIEITPEIHVKLAQKPALENASTSLLS